MKYDPKKITEETKVALEWHGDDTKVLVRGDSAKTPVKKGGILEVSVPQAKELLAYSHLWTLKGDKPLKHGYNEMIAKTVQTSAKKSSAKTENKIDEDVDCDPDKAEKKTIVKALKKLGVTFNDKATRDELAGLLKETKAEIAKNAETVEEGTETEQGIAHYVTQEDLDNNEDFGGEVKLGDLVFIPKPEKKKKK